MDTLTLFITLLTLMVLLIFLVLAYVWLNRAKPTGMLPDALPSFQELMHRIVDKGSSNTVLNRSVDEIIERFIVIDDKERKIEDFITVIETLCLHDESDSKAVLKLDKALRSANPRYKERIEKTIKTALAQRDKKKR